MPEARTPDPAVIDAVVDAQIRPLLNVHGGDIEVVSVSPEGHVELKFHGACQSCALKSVTYAVAVRERLLRFPGVTSVEVHGVSLSDAALERTKKAYAGYQLMFRTPDASRAAAPPRKAEAC